MSRIMIVLTVVLSVVGLVGHVVGDGPLGDDSAPEPAGRRCESPWSAPVSAAVVDGFRPPASPYTAGNRGLEYGTVGGEDVRAVAAGIVFFAGAVGGRKFVVVDHADGHRATYAYLDEITVAGDEPVDRGQIVARAAPGFHLTARLDGQYVDPTPLLAGDCAVVRLVPVPHRAARRLPGS